MNLAGKRALVTGGTKGMGAAVVAALEAGGAAVAVVARHDDGNATAPVIQADLATAMARHRRPVRPPGSWAALRLWCIAWAPRSASRAACWR